MPPPPENRPPASTISSRPGCFRLNTAGGVGTTFEFLVPAARAAATPPVARPAARGTETLLVAADEDVVRPIARISREARGHTIPGAGDGADAVRVAARHPGPIRLLVADVVVPGTGGRDRDGRALTEQESWRRRVWNGRSSPSALRFEGMDVFRRGSR